MSKLGIDKLSILCIDNTSAYDVDMYKNCLYQVQTKIILHIPNIDIKILSVSHDEKFSIPHIDKRFLSICHIDNLYTCGIENIFMSKLGIYKLSILCIYNT